VNTQRRRAIFEALRQANPEPRSELEFRTPFELLVAVVLSAQATDRSVNLATRALFRAAATPAAVLQIGEQVLIGHIKAIGLCRALVDQHGGQVPRTREALEALPGVGRKTANVVLNVAFGEPTIAVDTHIFRVANRTGLAPGKDVAEVEQRLLKTVPQEFRQHAHHWLILHGRYVCVARKPKCWQCGIARWCDFSPKTAPPD